MSPNISRQLLRNFIFNDDFAWEQGQGLTDDDRQMATDDDKQMEGQTDFHRQILFQMFKKQSCRQIFEIDGDKQKSFLQN